MQLQELWMKSLLQECRRQQSLSGIQVRLFIAHCHPGWDPEAQVCGEFISAKETMFSKSLWLKKVSWASISTWKLKCTQKLKFT